MGSTCSASRITVNFPAGCQLQWAFRGQTGIVQGPVYTRELFNCDNSPLTFRNMQNQDLFPGGIIIAPNSDVRISLINCEPPPPQTSSSLLNNPNPSITIERYPLSPSPSESQPQQNQNMAGRHHSYQYPPTMSMMTNRLGPVYQTSPPPQNFIPMCSSGTTLRLTMPGNQNATFNLCIEEKKPQCLLR